MAGRPCKRAATDNADQCFFSSCFFWPTQIIQSLQGSIHTLWGCIIRPSGVRTLQLQRGTGQESSAYISSEEFLHMVLMVTPIPTGRVVRIRTIQTSQHLLYTPALHKILAQAVLGGSTMQWQLRLLSIFSNTTINEVRIRSVCFTATNTASSCSSHSANIAVRKQSSLHSESNHNGAEAGCIMSSDSRDE